MESRAQKNFTFSHLYTGARVDILSPSSRFSEDHFPISASSIHRTHCSLSTHSKRGFSHQLPSTCFFPPVGSVSSKYSHLPAPGLWLLQAMSGKYVIKAVCHKSINSTQLWRYYNLVSTAQVGLDEP